MKIVSQRRSSSRKSPNNTKIASRKPEGRLFTIPKKARYLVIIFLVLLIPSVYLIASLSNTENKLRLAIEKTAKANQFAESEKAWQKLSIARPESVTAKDRVAWATAALRADHPGAALSILDQWKSASPEMPDGWLLLLDLLRVLGDADQFSSELNALLQTPVARRTSSVLSSATLGLLTDLDQSDVRSRLKKWVEKEPDQPLAQAALLLRYATNPLPDDPSRDVRLQEARELLQRFPQSLMARSALVETLFNSGLYEEAAEALEGWPQAGRNSTAWHRLQGRRLQDQDQNPAAAVTEFQQVLKSMPHDWKTRYRLARALKASGSPDEANLQARRMTEIREMLEPTALEPILKRAIPKGRPPEPSPLIELLQRLQLHELAKSWLYWQTSQRLMQAR